MAKREISSTLRNLKFMQRATQREEKTKKVEEEVIPEGNFPSSGIPRKCVVIMEGDPHPGASKGRMSFLSFNPAVDKLNTEAADTDQPEGSSMSAGNQDQGIPNREIGSAPECSKIDRNGNDANEDLKRKHDEMIPEVSYPNKSPKKFHGDQESTSRGKSSHKQPKHEKLDWNVLRPPKPQKRSG